MTTSSTMALRGRDAKAWPFAEARQLVERLEKLEGGENKATIFETGYGPSGLPHIGTFGEVVRTSMVRHAYEIMTGQRARLISFSDDMDALRKVPDNVPNREMMATHIGKPLTEVPDPFETHDSFGAHNNARLRQFLDGFGFEYEFFSATECYQGGVFDQALLTVLTHYEKILKVVLPTLGDERKATYSPFLPVCPRSRQVLQTPITSTDAQGGTVTYNDPVSGEAITVPVTGGGCKLQWKCDWAMRWVALGVDYEMSGKDLSESVTLSSRICSIMGGTPPAGFSYELFLDQNGEKISKSRGNGLSVEEWLAFASNTSLALFMYHQPRRAKKLFFDVIPKSVDEYFSHLAAYSEQSDGEKLENPVWHIHQGLPPTIAMPVTFSLLLNLAAVCQAETSDVIRGYVENYLPEDGDIDDPHLIELIDYAVAYYQDRIKPNKQYRAPTEDEKTHLAALAEALLALPADSEAEAIQSAVFAIGTEAGYQPLRDWFSCLYQVLLGQEQGPRMGSFIKLYGVDATTKLIERAIAGELAAVGSLPASSPAIAVRRLAAIAVRSLAVSAVGSPATAAALRRLPPELAHRLAVRGLGYVPPLPPLPSFSLPSLPSFSLPSLPSFSLPPLPSFSLPPLPSFSLPPLPSFSLPPLPSFSLPPLPNTPRLRQNVLGLDFDHPLGLAAGFDKDAKAITGCLSLGFSSVEVGTLTPKPQKGNPKPRVFRLPQDRAIINRYGFNNRGCEDAQARLGQARETVRRGVIGVNIGANKDSLDKREDYATATRMLARYADYLTINISCPNTPGLLAMQNATTIKEILAITSEAMADTPCPILVKLAPDMSDKDFLAALDASAENGAAGVILTNTTQARPESLKAKAKCQQGGLSGAPLFYRSTELLLKARRHLGDQIALIGVGGVRDAATAYAKILAGASLVQLHSAWIFGSARLPKDIVRELDSTLKDEGIANISEAVGSMDDLSEICRKCQIAEFD